MRSHRNLILIPLLSAAVVLSLFLAPAPGYASTFTVNTTDDLEDGTCDGVHCSLREAIKAANFNAGPDIITFNIPVGLDPGCDVTSGVCTIMPLTELPPLTENGTEINGFSQPTATPPSGLTPAALRIVLDGSSGVLPASADGLKIAGSGGTSSKVSPFTASNTGSISTAVWQ